MAEEKFSTKLEPFGGQIRNAALEATLVELREYLLLEKFSILCWDEHRIALPIEISVEIPPLGTFDNIDIRQIEPILIVFNLTKYPHTAPKIYADRLDFPKRDLAHLYIADAGKPTGFCLVREGLDEWYAGKRSVDLIRRIKNWLRDAALGDLTTDGNQFEPLRLEGYRGSSTYVYDRLAEIVHGNQCYEPDQNFAVALFENAGEKDEYPSFRLISVVNQHEYLQSLEQYMKAANNVIGKKSISARPMHFGFILWSRDPQALSNYSVRLPRDWESFQDFCNEHAIEIEHFKKFLGKFEFTIFGQTPIVVGVKRPKNIIGFSSNVEFINFYAELQDSDRQEDQIIKNVPFHFQRHQEPLTTDNAKAISGIKSGQFYATIVGCGALGSKIVLHLARSGITRVVLLDPDFLSPHNLVRHALLANHEGVNKAVAIAEVANNIFRFDGELKPVLGAPADGHSFISKAEFKDTACLKRIFDFTASEAFMNSLIASDLNAEALVFRSVISDYGNLGIGLLEGTERNPRLDDLRSLLFAEYSVDHSICSWLKRENETKDNSITLSVGVGCNSETIVLSDPIVSLHAAFFAGLITEHKAFSAPEDSGRIFLNVINRNNGEFGMASKEIIIPKLFVMNPQNNADWEIRIVKRVIDTIQVKMKVATPNETGGIFVGRANYKTKTIHVTAMIDPPPDSRATHTCFSRGILGLPEKITAINEESGGQLGYIGEWHTHPSGTPSMSQTDFATAQRFKTEFVSMRNSIPVFMMIFSPKGMAAYIF